MPKFHVVKASACGPASAGPSAVRAKRPRQNPARPSAKPRGQTTLSPTNTAQTTRNAHRGQSGLSPLRPTTDITTPSAPPRGQTTLSPTKTAQTTRNAHRGQSGLSPLRRNTRIMPEASTVQRPVGRTSPSAPDALAWPINQHPAYTRLVNSTSPMDAPQ